MQARLIWIGARCRSRNAVDWSGNRKTEDYSSVSLTTEGGSSWPSMSDYLRPIYIAVGLRPCHWTYTLVKARFDQSGSVIGESASSHKFRDSHAAWNPDRLYSHTEAPLAELARGGISHIERPLPIVSDRVRLTRKALVSRNARLEMRVRYSCEVVVVNS